MSGMKRLGAMVAASLLLPGAGGARPDVIGVVTEANNATLGAYSLTAGSSVFDGDRLSTGAGGAMQLSGEKTRVYLKEDSSAILRKKTDSEEKGLVAELTGGEMVLSSAKESGSEILVREARIYPRENAEAIVQVRVAGPKALIVFARRGTTEFSYRGETAEIAEGRSYRVELDPGENDGSADEKNKKAAHKKRKFKLIAIGAGVAVGAAAGIWATQGGSSGTKAVESPDRP